MNTPVPPKIPASGLISSLQVDNILKCDDIIVNNITCNDITLLGSTSGGIVIQVPETVSTYDVVLPDSQGAPNTFLKNDGAGNLSWNLANIAAGLDTQVQYNKNGILDASSDLTFSSNYLQTYNIGLSGSIGITEGHNPCVSLSVDGTILAVGSNDDDNDVGATWIFNYSGGVWNEIVKIVAPDAIGNANQGQSVSLSADGTVLAFGGKSDDTNIGATWIYNNVEGTWTQIAKLVGTGNLGAGGQGYSVSLSASGTILAIGSPGDDSGIGATWIFENIVGTWTEITKLVGTGNIGNSQQGVSISLSSDGLTLAVGGWTDDSVIGATWIFKNTGTWNQVTKLVGTGYIGLSTQGCSVSLNENGTLLAVGGRIDNADVGATWVFQIIDGLWTQIVKLVADDAIGISQQGWSVALSRDGSTLAIGGPSDNTFIGATWVFKNISGTWTQIVKLVPNANFVNGQGYSVALSYTGSILASESSVDNFNVGSTWMYQLLNLLTTKTLSVTSNVGFFGKTPVSKQNAVADVDSILALLKAYGLTD